jgi:phage-related protein
MILYHRSVILPFQCAAFFVLFFRNLATRKYFYLRFLKHLKAKTKMGSADYDPTSGATHFAGAAGWVGASMLQVFFALVGVVSAAFSALPFIIITLAISAAMIPWVRHSPMIVEYAENGMRAQVYPVWRDTVRDIANLVRQIWNPLICWFNALNWWGYGMVREVIFPVVRRCGIKQVLVDLGIFLRFVAEDGILPIANGSFMTEDISFARITPSGIAMVNSWITLYTCACFDLADVVKVIPLLNPLIFVPPAYPIMIALLPFSGEWADPQTWCVIENLTNAVIALVRQAIRLVDQLLHILFDANYPPNTPFIRPDLREFITKLCPAISCAVRSFENAYQELWTKYVPFKFVFWKFLCIVDSLACILLKTIALVVRLLINIDQVVLYPGNPFWETVMKPDMIEIVNLYVAPTYWADIPVPRLPEPTRFVLKSWYYDTNSQTTPLGAPNPVYNMTRLDECICIFITRLICDPSDQSTACFSQTAQNLLMGLDFCCLTNTILKGLADIVSGLGEFSFHLSKGPDEFFLFIDQQPFTTLIKNDIVALVRCIFSFFGLIPVVGTAIRELIVGIFDYVLSMIDFLGRVIIGLLTLPYFLISLPTLQNFVQATNVALNFFIAIQDQVVADTPTSIKNSACVLLNNGFPVPPVPCSTCVVSGFVPPPAHKKKFARGDVIYSPLDLLRESVGWEPMYQVTPLIVYENHTYNPIKLYNMIKYTMSTTFRQGILPFDSVDAVNQFVDQKKAQMLEQWGKRRRCSQQADEMRRLQVENLKLFQYNERQGKYAECVAQSPAASRPGLATPHPDFDPRLTLGPTQPAVNGCSPSPPCYDLCCIVRTSLVLIMHILKFFARFINGLVQGSHTAQGTLQDYPYFTGELANKGLPTFQSDITQLILYIFAPIECLCEVLNLIIPVVGNQAFTNGRPDICCFVQRLAELIACIIQVIINMVNSLALGQSQNFAYFRNGQFYTDVSMVFDVVLALIDCLCIFVEAVFPLNFVPGFRDATDFDICCAPVAILVTITESLRLILQMIISLATITITPSSYCYWRLDKTVDHDCGATLDKIGLVVQIDKVIDSFLPMPGANGGACMMACGIDNGATGIVPCICQIFNTLIPWRRFPDKRVNCTLDSQFRNCPRTDFCCPFGKLGFFISDSLKFIVRGIVALWQPWNGLPEFFIHYFFCDEGVLPRCPRANVNYETSACSLHKYYSIPSCPGTHTVWDSNNVQQQRCGEFTCGKVNVALLHLLDPFEGLIARCTCQFISLLDQLVALLFNILRIVVPQTGWACCFCGGLQTDPLTGWTTCNVNSVGPCGTLQGYMDHDNVTTSISLLEYGSSGILTSVSYTANQILVALTGFLRKFPLACYWKACIPHDPPSQICTNGVPQRVEETWIFSFLGPTANALCISVGNMQCFAQSLFLLPRVCLYKGQRFLGSTVRWAAEIIFRVIGFIEAFVKTFTQEPNTCVGPTCNQGQGTKVVTTKGVDSKKLGSMLVILLSIPNDLLIGDSEVACTTVCPYSLSPRPADYDWNCGCWNLSPMYGAGQLPLRYAFQPSNSMCIDPTAKPVPTHVGSPWGLNTTNPTLVNSTADIGCCVNITNVGGARQLLPVCINDIDLPSTIIPGPCSKLAACRPDSLPSAAFDPMMPTALAVGFTQALDGVVMGFVRYMRCLLSNLFCDKFGRNCIPFGSILYPLQLIMSIVWQILGGVIRFVAACILFLFSLFTATDTGNGCECYQSGQLDGYGQTVTNYWARVSGFCYECQLWGYRCDMTHTDDLGFTAYEAVLCPAYCPGRQRARNPAMTEAQAIAQCLLEYPNATLQHPTPWINASFACTPSNAFPQVYGPYCYSPNNGTTTPGSCSPLTFNDATFGMCGGNWDWHGNGFGVEPSQLFLTPDICLFGYCDYNNPARPVGPFGLLGNHKNWYPCSGPHTAAANRDPDNPVIPCGLLQAIQGFIDVINAFVEIFTTPLLLPSLSEAGDVLKRGAEGGAPFQGPRNHESFHTFRARAAAIRKEQTVYKRLIYWTTGGFNEDQPNILQAFTDAMYNYDTSDCHTDPVSCVCRNVDLDGHCVYDATQRRVVFLKRDTPMSPNEVTTIASQVLYNGNTVCDHVALDAANVTWDGMGHNHRNEWVKCFDRLVQGHRMHALTPIVPKDWGYNPRAPYEMIQQYYSTATKEAAATRRRQGKTRSSVEDWLVVNRPASSTSSPDDLLGNEDLTWEQIETRFHKRRQQTMKTLVEKGDFRTHDLMFEAVVEADLLHYKYTSGYYGKLLHSAAQNLARNGPNQFPTTKETLQMMRDAFTDIGTTITRQPYAEVVRATSEAFSVLNVHGGRVMEEGLSNFVRTHYDNYLNYRQDMYSSTRKRKVEEFVDTLYESPLYKWWTYVPPEDATPGDRKSLTAPFWEHMERTIAFQREHWQTESFNFFNADLKFWSAADLILNRWQKPQWTPEQIKNWERLKGFYYSVYDRLWPGTLTHEVKERYLFFSNCELVSKAVDLSMKVIDYCVSDAVANMNFTTTNRRSLLVDPSHRESTRNAFTDKNRFLIKPSADNDPNAWNRPKLIRAEPQERHVHKVHFRQYRRTTSANLETHGPAGFNFFDWFVARFEDITEWALGSQVDSWFEDIKQWVQNTNTDIALYPDVGLLYWVKFPFTCHFPENLNCSLGSGVEFAVLWVTVGFIIAVVISGYFFPPITLPLQIFGFALMYWFIFAAVAWHYSPACWFIFPSFPIPIGTTLPMCIADEVYAFLNKWITNCYSPLLIPPYMISGDLCPTDPTQFIDFLDCRDVGVSDGIQNFLYAGFYLWGKAFSDVVMSVIVPFFPQWRPYLVATMDSFANANPTQMERLNFCFFWTLPAIFLPGLWLFMFGLIAGILIPPIIGLCVSLVNLFFATPFASGFNQQSQEEWIGEDQGVYTLSEESPSSAKNVASYINQTIMGIRWRRRSVAAAAKLKTN